MKNIIFDWSGVVKDAAPVQIWIVNKILHKYGVAPITFAELQEKWIQPPIRFYNQYIPELTEEQEEADYREAIFDPSCPTTSSFPGMISLIQQLKKEDAFLAVVSSDVSVKLHEEIKKYGLEEVFSEVVTDALDKTEPVRELIKKYALQPNDTYFIGDSNHEIEVAKECGIRSIATTWGFAHEETLRAYNPEYIVHTAEELSKIVL